MKVRIVNKSKHPLPEYKTKSSAGLDIRANIDEPIMLKSLERKLVPTGLFTNYPMATRLRCVREVDWL